MTIYIYILIILLLLWIFSHLNSNYSNTFLYVGTLILIIVASFKDQTVGTDSLGYYQNFESIRFDSSTRAFSGTQIGWYYVNLFFYDISNYTVFLLFCYSLIYGSFAYFIKRNSNDKLLSLILIYLFCYGASLNIMRQYIAIGLFCVAIDLLVRDKTKLSLLMIGIGSFFHFSILLMLPVYFIKFFRIKNFTVYIGVVSSFVIGFFVNIMTPIVMSLSFLMALNEGVNGYLDSWGGERNIMTNLLINIVFTVSYFYSKNRNSFFLKMWFLYIILSNLFGASPQGNRIFLYLFMGMFIAIPNIKYQLKNWPNYTLYISMILIYALGFWYVVLSSGQNEIIPYNFRF